MHDTIDGTARDKKPGKSTAILYIRMPPKLAFVSIVHVFMCPCAMPITSPITHHRGVTVFEWRMLSCYSKASVRNLTPKKGLLSSG